MHHAMLHLCENTTRAVARFVIRRSVAVRIGRPLATEAELQTKNTKWYMRKRRPGMDIRSWSSQRAHEPSMYVDVAFHVAPQIACTDL